MRRRRSVVALTVNVIDGDSLSIHLQPTMERLRGDIQDGMLDYVLTKLEDAQLIVSVREIRIWRATDIVVGLMPSWRSRRCAYKCVPVPCRCWPLPTSSRWAA